MNENDKNILNNLIEIKYNPSNDSQDFTVEFIFKENEYFEPNILTKTYKIDEKDDLISIDASKITWKNEDKNPTIKMKKKSIKKGKKVIKKNVKVKVDSFFNFFKSFEKKNEKKNNNKSNSSSDSDSDSENSENEVIEDFEDEVSFFKEDFFKNQLEYYLNIMEINDENDKEEDEGDDESEEGSDEETKGKKKGKVFGKRKKSGNKKENEEKKNDCKNQ